MTDHSGEGRGAQVTATTSSEREMNLRFAGQCTACGEQIPTGSRAVYSPSTRSVRHLTCPNVDAGTAGSSAMREYQRRMKRDTARISAQRDNIGATFGGGIVGKIATLIAVDDSPRRSTTVWKQGAEGEKIVAVRLDKLAEVGVRTLHDRRIPGTRANIDHLVITPWGVWVVDAKRYLDKRPELVVSGGFFSSRQEHLRVGGRAADKLIDGVLWQAERVESALGNGILVQAALCFVDADWPLIGGAFTVQDVRVVWPGRLAKTMLRADAPLLDVDEVVRVLAWPSGRLSTSNWLGILVGMLGVAAIVGLDVGGSDIGAVAELAVVVVGYALGPAILSRWLSDLPGVGIVAVSLAGAALIYVPIVLLTGGWPTAVPSGQVIFAMVVLAVICSALAFVLLVALVAETGPVRATAITYINPAVAILVGALVLGERITVWTIVGFALVLAGSYLVTRRRAEPVAPASAEEAAAQV